MSYRETYQASITYNGSVSYNYPASEHGGSSSASFSVDIPVNVTIDVNTHPFDGSVDRFNTSIDMLGGSVVTMHAAQCAAINQTAGEVSSSLINGFFGLIKTELSQQLQALDSAIKACFGLIKSQGEAVIGKKTQMETDYNRIGSRYVNLFDELDKECYKRIYALDKASFNISENVQRRLLSESSSGSAALNLLGMEEESASRMLIFVSSLNRKTLDVLKTLRDYITQETRINALIDSFLVNEELSENIQVYIPVIWSESGSLADSESVQECFFAGQTGGQEAITQKTSAFCGDSGNRAWEVMGETEKETLNREFTALAERCFADAGETEQRVYKTMLALWEKSEISSLKGVRDE